MLVFNIIFPIIAVSLLGYLVAWFKLFNDSHLSGISRYVYNIAIPVLLFNAMSTVDLPDRIPWEFFIAYFGSALLVFAIGNLLGRLVYGYRPAGHAMIGMGAAYGNTVLIGIPVVDASMGEVGLLPLFLLISIHSAILFTATTVVAESESEDGMSRRDLILIPLRKIFQNPIILGLIAGLLFNASGLTLPVSIENTIQTIRGSALPCSLFVLGAALSAYSFTGAIDKAVVITVIKMIMLPLLVFYLSFHVFDLPPMWRAVAVLTSSLPTGINVAIFADKYQAAVAPVNTAVLLSTIISIGTIPLMLAWLL